MVNTTHKFDTIILGGGIAGPLRVDLNRQYCHAPNTEYSEGQARAAFDRAVAHHARNGW